MAKFTHLHLHTEYSLLDGTIRIESLVEKLKELNMDACAISDHGVMYGAFKFHNALKSEGIKPIIGCEIYVAPRSRHKKESGIDNKYMHMLLLAKNKEGYRNLMKISSIGHMEGFYYKPRVDIETLEKYSEGIIATSACLGGVVAKHLMKDNPSKAEEYAQKMSEIFKDRFYIEIQRNGIEEQKETNPKLLKIAEKFELPIVATCDAHYLNKEDAEVQEALWCIADGKTLDDPTRRQMGTQELYVKSSEEMEELFSDLPEAIENTQNIVDEIEEYSLDFGRVEPTYLDLPENETPKEHLRKLVLQGAERKYGELTDEIMDRINYELKIIDDKGYNNYFLLVYDFVNYCVENDIMVGSRGSAVGTVVGYALDIAGVDPLKWGLIFERFLNPGRNSPPDIDLDISDVRREELIKYTQEKYGYENTRQIITFSKLQTRAAIRDVSRILGIDLEIADRLSKMVDVVFGKAKDIDYMIENNPEFAQIIESDPKLQKMAEIVRKIAGLSRGTSMHACGVIVTPDPVENYAPIQRDAKSNDVGMTQYEMSDVEYVGLLKLDFLGLRNMSIIDSALKKIEKYKGVKIDLDEIDEEDPEVYQTLQKGHTVGVFQLDSAGMKKTIRMIKPTNPEELCYLLAAYRPGPMDFIPEYVDVKEGQKDPEYLVDDLEPILGVTNGVVTYQEQVMKIATDLAGYSLADADILRRAMGKKKMKIMKAEKPKFIQGGVDKGYPKEAMEEIWELLVKFANYGFNKSHSAAYAMVAYYTAYLKTHYPVEFMAALLEGNLDNFDRVVVDLQECDRLGIEVFPPDVNKSDHSFTIEDNDIRFGLAAIKNVGEDAVKAIVEEREENGGYRNFDDFIYRSIKVGVQKRVIEYLIMAGAIDSLGDRNQLLEALEQIYERYKEEYRQQEMGQIDIFSAGNGEEKTHIDNPVKLPEVEKTPVYQKLDWEKELLGLYISSHPLDNLREFFEEKGAKPISEILEMDPSRTVHVIGGIPTEVKRITTKKGDPMAFMTVEDKSGSVEMVVFPRVYEELREEIVPNKPMLIAGKLNERNGTKNIILEKAKVVNPAKFGTNFSGVTFKINGVHSEEEVLKLKETIKSNPGDTPVRIIMESSGDNHVMNLEHKVEMNGDIERCIDRFS